MLPQAIFTPTPSPSHIAPESVWSQCGSKWSSSTLIIFISSFQDQENPSDVFSVSNKYSLNTSSNYVIVQANKYSYYIPPNNNDKNVKLSLYPKKLHLHSKFEQQLHLFSSLNDEPERLQGAKDEIKKWGKLTVLACDKK